MRLSMNDLFRLPLILILVASTAFGAPAPTNIQTDKINFGRPNTNNKDIVFNVNAGATNPLLRANGSTGKLQFSNDGTNFSSIGAGSGGGVNYITNPDGQGGTSGYVAYQNTAQATPVTGTGGTPTHISIAATGTAPLRGTTSLVISNSGGTSAQGEGISNDFTIDPADEGKTLQASFDYRLNSGTFQPGQDPNGQLSDLTVYFYDRTNAIVIQPSTFKLYCSSTTLACTYRGTFQAASNSILYRMIWHVATTNTSAWAIKMSSVSVGPGVIPSVTPVLDWSSYTPTIVGFGTPTITESQWARVGDSLWVRGRFTSGVTTAVTATVSFPAGLSFDSSKESSQSNYGTMVNSTSTLTYSVLVGTSGGPSVISFGTVTGGSGLSSQTGTTISNNGNVIGYIAGPIPITGWSSSVQMSSSVSSRTIAARASASTSSIPAASDTDFINPTVNYDTAGAYNPATGVYTIAVPGKYTVKAAASFNDTAGNQTVSNNATVELYKNGSFYSAGSQWIPLAATTRVGILTFSDSVDCIAGNTLKLVVHNTLGQTLVGDGSQSYFIVERQAGPESVAVTDSIIASYNGTTTSVPNVTETTVVFNTKVEDTTGIYSAGTSTIPVSGSYSASSSVTFADSAGVVQRQLSIKKNGSAVCYTRNDIARGGATVSLTVPSCTFPAISGDLITIALTQQTGGAISPVNDSSTNFSLKRLGN